jgi:hypothetical protein
MTEPWSPYSGEEEFHDHMTVGEPPRVLEPALAAANRIIHGNGTENDSQLVAGVLIQLVDEVVKP